MNSASAWLFCPGDRPDRLRKAVARGAQHVIADLEDAVAPADKRRARDEVAKWIRSGASAWVRVNGMHTTWWSEDMDALAGLPGLRGVMLPKAESAAAAEHTRDRCGVPVLALIETARGIRAAHEIAESPAVERLAFGSIDYALDTSCDDSDEALLFARSTLVVASRAAAKPSPLDGVTTVINDAAAVTEAAERARRLGFGGKLCIHPSQVAYVAHAFRPTEEELAWARSVLEIAAGHGGSAAAIDGVMVDRPVIEHARRLLG